MEEMASEWLYALRKREALYWAVWRDVARARIYMIK